MPLVTANQFDLVPQFSNIGTGFAQGMQIGNQFRQRQQQAQISQFSQAALGGDADARKQLAVLDPEKSKQLESIFAGMTKEQKAEMLRENENMTRGALNIIKLSGNDPAKARVALQNQINEWKAQGLDTTRSEGALALDDGAMMQAIQEQASKGLELAEQARGILMPDASKQPFQKAEGGMVFDPNTGTFSVDLAAKKRLDEIARIKESGNKEIDAKTRQSISKDITGMIKDTVGIRNTAEDLDRLGSLGSGPASIAMVYKFMKSLDPASVVREGEFATAESAAGVPAQIANFYNKLVKGERLDDAQIKSFVVTAKELANSAIDSSTTEINKYLDTFEDSIPSSFIEKTKTRIPARFDISGGEVNIDDLVNKYAN